ncbi:hypothetical protein Ptr902_10462 [Pyrenophora tritici-repentis]|nr:hypothetical protein Ptr902_10462 [Pyrenophora tritici-repentis]
MDLDKPSNDNQEILVNIVPDEISLPEDNAASMRLICAIIHHQNQHVPDNLSARNILGVAVAADKYGCVPTLKFASGHWFCGRNEEASDLVVLAAAAYLLRNEKAFREIAKTMILTHNSPYYKLCSVEVESVMDWKVFCMLEEARSLARLKLANILIKRADDPTGKPNGRPRSNVGSSLLRGEGDVCVGVVDNIVARAKQF